MIFTLYTATEVPGPGRAPALAGRRAPGDALGAAQRRRREDPQRRPGGGGRGEPSLHLRVIFTLQG